MAGRAQDGVMLNANLDGQNLPDGSRDTVATQRSSETEHALHQPDKAQLEALAKTLASSVMEKQRQTSNGQVIQRADHISADSKAGLAFFLLNDLLDECMFDVYTETHKQLKLTSSLCQICGTRCRKHVVQPNTDIFGNAYNSLNLPLYECLNCGKMFPAGRYAPHLEKCLGLAGRASSRVANRRMGSASPYTSANSDDFGFGSDSDGGSGDQRKKKKLTNGKSSPSKAKKSRSFFDVESTITKARASKLSQSTTADSYPPSRRNSAPTSPTTPTSTDNLSDLSSSNHAVEPLHPHHGHALKAGTGLVKSVFAGGGGTDMQRSFSAPSRRPMNGSANDESH
ncbi:hypothetical protein BZG36_04350 [Bifiguratus adelaidae]|uniref:SAGA-associated factor 11 n=1 Tax=Bifiguratus adelaidae TaxID=1938954 RepID=A0A261XWU6_9FUNG|nr:hypothetical protein BZG36_04350 [Bifiguratus adelaidae]